jgi:protein-arginine kinase activator protein McsA
MDWPITGRCLNKEWTDAHVHDVVCTLCGKLHHWLKCEKKQSCPDCELNLLEHGKGKKLICGMCHKLYDSLMNN